MWPVDINSIFPGRFLEGVTVYIKTTESLRPLKNYISWWFFSTFITVASSTCTGSSYQPVPHHSHISSSPALHSAWTTQLHFLSQLSTTYPVFLISLSHICLLEQTLRCLLQSWYWQIWNVTFFLYFLCVLCRYRCRVFFCVYADCLHMCTCWCQISTLGILFNVHHPWLWPSIM